MKGKKRVMHPFILGCNLLLKTVNGSVVSLKLGKREEMGGGSVLINMNLYIHNTQGFAIYKLK